MENCKESGGTTKMFEHECESDEDCEVYFLKPVNEYNIVDKIKEANKELFADDTDEDTTTTTTTTTTTDEATTAPMSSINKKVTFATNLEDYEPTTAANEQKDTIEEPLPPPSLDCDGIQKKLSADFKFPIIDEEQLLEEEVEEEEIGEILHDCSLQKGNVAATDNTKNEANAKIQSDFDEADATNHNKGQETKTNEIDSEIVEEICEEIIIMDMENDNETLNIRSPSVESQQQQRNKIIKQTTFDYDGSDDKSLTNLLTSDFEEEADETHDNLHTKNENVEEDDDDEEDHLSIIVASYIPDNFDKDSLVSADSNSNLSPKVTKHKKLPFTKRFSFRRKTASATPSTSNASLSCQHMPPPEVTDLKLNYKTCCEYRNAVLEKLPRYTGYLSEYGLTREQLAKREAKLQRKKRFVLEQALKANEHEMRKMQDNERAFTTWLKQKMRFPINKTRNMFDVNRLPGGCASGSSVRNRNSSGKIK